MSDSKAQEYLTTWLERCDTEEKRKALVKSVSVSDITKLIELAQKCELTELEKLLSEHLLESTNEMQQLFSAITATVDDPAARSKPSKILCRYDKDLNLIEEKDQFGFSISPLTAVPMAPADVSLPADEKPTTVAQVESTSATVAETGLIAGETKCIGTSLTEQVSSEPQKSREAAAPVPQVYEIPKTTLPMPIYEGLNDDAVQTHRIDALKARRRKIARGVTIASLLTLGVVGAVALYRRQVRK
jgi:hypothetical protein